MAPSTQHEPGRASCRDAGPLGAARSSAALRTRPDAGQGLGGYREAAGASRSTAAPRLRRTRRPLPPLAARELPKAVEAVRVAEPKAAERARAECRASGAGQRAAAPPVGCTRGAAPEPDERRPRRGRCPRARGGAAGAR